MKHKQLSRALAALLCLVMAFGLAAAFAEGPDLSALTDDEITALLTRVTEEIVRRGLEKTASLSKGTYVAGTDIPAGRYIYTCRAAGDDWGNLTVDSDRSDDDFLWYIVSAPKSGEAPETIYLTLREGDVLKSTVPFSLTVNTGFVFR